MVQCIEKIVNLKYERYTVNTEYNEEKRFIHGKHLCTLLCTMYRHGGFKFHNVYTWDVIWIINA